VYALLNTGAQLLPGCRPDTFSYNALQSIVLFGVEKLQKIAI
jgi:hypothetical protein